MSGIRTVMSRIWTESFSDLRNMASFHWPYPWHRFLMSGIWPVITVHILVKNWYPAYGQFSLSISRTSNFDVQNMDSENWPYRGHCPYPRHYAMSGIWPGRAMGLDPRKLSIVQDYGLAEINLCRSFHMARVQSQGCCVGGGVGCCSREPETFWNMLKTWFSSFWYGLNCFISPNGCGNMTQRSWALHN